MATVTTESDEHKMQLHVAMFPWLAFGHILPFLELSKFIAQKGHRVSFLSTTRNIQRISDASHHPLINLVKLTLPRVQELSQNVESTMDLDIDDVPYLKIAFDGLQPEVARFLEEESPDWIIYDFASHWLPPVAAALGISRAIFSIFNAWTTSFLAGSADDLINGTDYRKSAEDFLTPPKRIPFPTKVCYRKHEANLIFRHNISVNSSGVSDTYCFGLTLKGSDCMFIRHCYEFEPQWLTLLENLYHLPVVPVGLLPPTKNIGDNGKDDTWVTVNNWLNGQQKGHVVYVAFGSEAPMSKSELVELALGLELSGLPFFWALRKPTGSSKSNLVEWLPEGFLERTHNRGMVWTSWVPQLQILSHVSVCGFLTHCGWSSTVEAMMFGHPLIMLPLAIDQGLNARVMVEKQLGIEIPRNDEDGSFTRESVARSLRSVILDDEGKIYKANAMDLSQRLGDTKLENKYINPLIEYLKMKGCVVATDHEH